MKEEKKQNSNGPGRMGDLVEKLVRRTESFSGEGFLEWRFKTMVSLKAVHADCGRLAEWATGQTRAISVGEISEEQVMTDNILYSFLTAVTKGEAFDLVKNVSNLCGLEAWRKLAKRFGGNTRGKRVVLTRRCVNPAKVKKLPETPGMIEKWEADIRRLKAEYDEELSDGLKCGILLEIVPNQVTEFMTQRMEESDTYHDTKEAVLRYVEAKADFGGAVPMELDVGFKPSM